MNGQFVLTYCLCWTRMDSNSSFGRLLAQPATPPASLISSSVTRFRRVSHKSLFTRHDLVTWILSAPLKPKPQLVAFRFRSLNKVDWARFQDDLRQSELFTNPADNASDFAEQLDAVIVDILNRHCPIHERKRFMSARRDNRWLSASAVDAKRQRRRLERRWRTTRRSEDYVAYRKMCRTANKVITESRGAHYTARIAEAAGDPRRRWAAIRNTLHQTEPRIVRSSVENR